MLRHVVRELLAIRHPAALGLPAIRRLAAREVDFKIEDAALLSALGILEGLNPPQVKVERDALGPSQYYAATSAGVLAQESNDAC